MNKREHILNGLLIGIGVGLLLDHSSGEAALRSVVAVAVPVTLGALFPDIDTEFGAHRKTFHNIFILGGFIAFPFVFDNLNYVWIGVLTHFVLDTLGSRRGIGLFYPFDRSEWNPLRGVTVSSKFASVVTLLISACELVIAYLVIIGSATAGITLPIG